MIRWNLFFEVEKVEQLALIDRLAAHHDRPPSLKASGKRNHDSSISTRPFSTGSTQLRHGRLKTFCSAKALFVPSLKRDTGPLLHAHDLWRVAWQFTSDGENSYSHWAAQQLRGRSRRARSNRNGCGVSSITPFRRPTSRWRWSPIPGGRVGWHNSPLPGPQAVVFSPGGDGVRKSPEHLGAIRTRRLRRPAIADVAEPHERGCRAARRAIAGDARLWPA